MEFLNLDATRAETWDRIVSTSAEGWLFGLYRWTQLLPQIPVWKFRDFSFLVIESGQAVAAVPLQLRLDGGLCSPAMGASGPMLSTALPAGKRDEVLEAIFSHIRKIAKECGAQRVEVALNPLSEACLVNRGARNPLIRFGFEDQSTQTWMLDLSPGKEHLLSNLSQKVRWSIKQPEKKGYRVRPIKNRDEMNIYYEIHCETYGRTGAIPHPREYFLGIYDQFTAAQLCRTWAAVREDDAPVGFMNVGVYRKKALYWTSCCRNEDYRNGVYYLLMWHAIEAAKAEGMEWFDCGEAFPDAPAKSKERGLSDFKKKFGGKLRPSWKGRLVIRKPPVLKRVRGILGAAKRRIAPFLRRDGK